MKRSITLRLIQSISLLMCLMFCFSCFPKKIIYSTPLSKCSYGKPYKISNKWYYPMTYVEFFEQKGIASWYGKQFHGRKTSNGETFNMYDVSAAHKTLPLGSVVKIFNLDNKKCLTVRINDRGPFVKGRIIDLSYGAARRLGFVNKGTANVYLRTISTPPPPKRIKKIPYDLSNASNCFQIQVGAFAKRGNAESLCNRLKPIYNDAHIIQTNTSKKEAYYRVMIGNCMPQQKAMYMEQQLGRHGFRDAFVVAQN